MHAGQQQRARIAVTEPVDPPLREPGEEVVAETRSRRTHDCDALGEQPSGDETQDLRRGTIKPLRVVDDADQRLPLRDLGEQRQRREPHQEPFGRRTRTLAKYRRERLPLRDRQPRKMIQHGCAELMQATVSQLHLRLHADSPGDVPAVDLAGQVPQQRGLPDARLTTDHGHLAPAGERAGQELVERLALGPTSEKPREGRTGLSSQHRLPNASNQAVLRATVSPQAPEQNRRNRPRRTHSVRSSRALPPGSYPPAPPSPSCKAAHQNALGEQPAAFNRAA